MSYFNSRGNADIKTRHLAILLLIIKIGTQWVLVSAAICIGLKIVFLLTADGGIAVKALSSLVFLALGMTLVC